VFERIAEYPISRIEELLPWNAMVAIPRSRPRRRCAAATFRRGALSEAISSSMSSTAGARIRRIVRS